MQPIEGPDGAKKSARSGGEEAEDLTARLGSRHSQTSAEGPKGLIRLRLWSDPLRSVQYWSEVVQGTSAPPIIRAGDSQVKVSHLARHRVDKVPPPAEDDANGKRRRRTSGLEQREGQGTMRPTSRSTCPGIRD
jgi:hypothetical protein